MIKKIIKKIKLYFIFKKIKRKNTDKDFIY